MGMKMCSDALERVVEFQINFTSNACDFLVKSALGIAKNTHDDASIKKGIHCSKTLMPLITEYNQFHENVCDLCKELDQRASNEKLTGRTITIEFKNDKFKNKQKSYTSRFYMGSYDEYRKIALQLLQEAWPCEPCRKLSVNLQNLKDEHGRVSESAHYMAMHITGGSTKLGGLTKSKQPEKAKKYYANQFGNP
jgi:hypothetical protein